VANNGDLEEDYRALEDQDQEAVGFWEKKQREVLTSVVDYNLGTLVELVEDGLIDLHPHYQRRERWDSARQSRLIESFLMNVPVPPVFLNEDAYGKYSVIDGKQRLMAIRNFIMGRLALTGLDIFKEINGLTFDGLPPTLRAVFKTRPTLRAVIVLHQSDEDVKVQVFERLNTGGATLNAQEIRNSVYTGPLNDLILKLSEDRLFHRLLGIKGKSQSRIWKEMRDAEYVLRYMAFRDSWSTFSGGMRRRMNEFMARNRCMDEAGLIDIRSDFLRTLGVVEACFDDLAFKRWIPEKGTWRKQVLVSVYDAQMFACRGGDPTKAMTRRDAILDGLRSLFSDDEFRQSVYAATNTPAYFKRRIEIMTEMLSRTAGW